MANTIRVTHETQRIGLDVKGSAAAFEQGDWVFQDNVFQGSTSNITLQPASAGSVGASASASRKNFADLMAGVAQQRHDFNSFDKIELPIAIKGQAEYSIYGSNGTVIAATGIVPPGRKVGIATDSSFRPLNQGIVVDGVNSIVVADNEAIGRTSHIIRSGQSIARFSFESNILFGQTGV